MSTGLKANPDGSAAIQVGGTDVITLTSGGAATFVTSPTTVQAGTAAAPSITTSGDTNTGIFFPAADTIAFAEGGVESMRIDSNGNVGIGNVTNPTNFANYTTVQIGDTTSGLLEFISGSTRIGGMFNDPAGSSNNGDFIIRNLQNGALQFHTNNTERARITSGGFFKATSTGTYSAGTTGGVHEFDTSAVDGTIVNFYNQAASNPNGIYVGYTAADPNDATRYVFGAQQNTGVWIYRIYSNGTVAARSDAKWKKNIETTRDGYAEDLAKLRVVKYNWYNHEDGTPKELGLIAQEVEQVFPGLVATDEQTLNEIKTREIPAVLDEEGNEVEPARTEEYTEKVGTGEYSKSIKFSVLPIMLLKAIQEQQAMIEEMKAEIAALKGAA